MGDTPHPDKIQFSHLPNLLISYFLQVVGAKVVTNARGPRAFCYGFVSMSSSSEAAKAINHLHRTELHGRTIHVERVSTWSFYSICPFLFIFFFFLIYLFIYLFEKICNFQALLMTILLAAGQANYNLVPLEISEPSHEELENRKVVNTVQCFNLISYGANLTIYYLVLSYLAPGPIQHDPSHFYIRSIWS